MTTTNDGPTNGGNDGRDDSLEDSRPPGAGGKEGSADHSRDRPFEEEPQTSEDSGDADAPGRWIVDPDSGPPPEPNEPA